MHAGNYSSRPYKNTYVFRTGKPLVNLLNEMWHKKEDERHLFNVVVPQIGATDANDDACLLCADGGDLICCEKCPSAFHPTCINMENIPQEDFLCTYCVCKHCGGINGDMLTCSMCGKRYHWDCYVDRENVDLNDTELALCCGPICKEVYWKFKRMLGVRHAMKEGLTWTLVHRMKPFEIEDEQTRIISNCKTEVAWDFLNECFSTATDRHSRINILQSVVCNRESNLTRMNFRGFFVALLENNDGIVSAATVRMHGKDLAEMPYIATQENYRGQGMARKLFDALGYVFSCIGLKEMVIPSIDHLAPMWQGKYGFTPIDDVVKHKLVNFNTLMFPGTIRLQKIFPDAPASFSAAAGCSAAASTSAAMDNKNDKNCKELALLNLNLDPPEPPEDEKVRPVIWIDD
ncbi:hypothetical protein JCGZ_03458 [Jatropha curcas]|uniref:PHD-type domain-containing protein n=2 Tax=Jatropha curcas TaxID=180498 RepID=A0A067KUU9_JATCU|nr:hypothetical protein JCGZ_03458 [Jatropha curcas]